MNYRCYLYGIHLFFDQVYKAHINFLHFFTFPFRSFRLIYDRSTIAQISCTRKLITTNDNHSFQFFKTKLRSKEIMLIKGESAALGQFSVSIFFAQVDNKESKTDSGRCAVEARLRRSPKSSSAARSQYLYYSTSTVLSLSGGGF